MKLIRCRFAKVFFILLFVGLLCISSVSAASLSDSNDLDDVNTFSNIDEISIDSIEDIEIPDNSIDLEKNLQSSDSNEDLDDSLNADSNYNSKNIENALSSQGSDTNINAQDPKYNASADLVNRINNADDNEIIFIEPGTYKIHNVTLTKNMTLQGIGNTSEVIIDGEYLSSIFLIHDKDVFVNFYNLTIIHGLTHNFGGGICIETGNAVVDNCIFINNTALNTTNGGAISNYGNENYSSYLLVNNSLFLGNHADHDGGAVTTCYARSDIYNSVFVNNSAVRDGGAIRVSIFGYGYVQDCVFEFNHADEWAGAYYSWAGNSSIDRCVFRNNTAGTNGGAIMISGSANLTNSVIVNNTADKTGGSFYIQQPMFNATTKINVTGCYITNNSAPLGQEVYIKWNSTDLFWPDFNKNDWGDENPKDPAVIDPDRVSERSNPTLKSDKSDLLDTLSWRDLLARYDGILSDYFAPHNDDSQTNSSDDISHHEDNNDHEDNSNPEDSNSFFKFDNQNQTNQNNKNNKLNDTLKRNILSNSLNSTSSHSTDVENPNSTSVSDHGNQKMVELFEDNPISLKSFDIKFAIALTVVLLAFFAGLLKRRERN